jgi:hypothetical protein
MMKLVLAQHPEANVSTYIRHGGLFAFSGIARKKMIMYYSKWNYQPSI